LVAFILLTIAYVAHRRKRSRIWWTAIVALVVTVIGLWLYFLLFQVNSDNRVDQHLVTGFAIFVIVGIVAASWLIDEFLIPEQRPYLFQNLKFLVSLGLLSLASVIAALSMLGVLGPGLQPVTVVLKKNAEVPEKLPSEPPSSPKCSSSQNAEGTPLYDNAETLLVSHAEGSWNILYILPECDPKGQLTSKKILLSISNDQVVEVRQNDLTLPSVPPDKGVAVLIY